MMEKLFGKFIGDIGMMTILVKAEELDNLPNWIWIDCEEDSQKPEYVLFEILDSVPEIGEIDGNIFYIYGEFNDEKFQHAEPVATFQPPTPRTCNVLSNLKTPNKLHFH